MDLEEELKAIEKICEAKEEEYGFNCNTKINRRSLLRIKYLAQEFEKSDEEIINYIFFLRPSPARRDGKRRFFDLAVEDAASYLEESSDPIGLIDECNSKCEKHMDDDYYSKEAYNDSLVSSVISGIQNDIWNDTDGSYAPGFENFDGFYSNSEPPVFGKELSEDEEPDEKVSYGDLGMQVYDSMLALSMNRTDIDSDKVIVLDNGGPSFRGH